MLWLVLSHYRLSPPPPLVPRAAQPHQPAAALSLHLSPSSALAHSRRVRHKAVVHLPRVLQALVHLHLPLRALLLLLRLVSAAWADLVASVRPLQLVLVLYLPYLPLVAWVVASVALVDWVAAVRSSWHRRLQRRVYDRSRPSIARNDRRRCCGTVMHIYAHESSFLFQSTSICV